MFTDLYTLFQFTFNFCTLNRGHRAVATQPAVRNPRYSIIAAINVDGNVAYNIIEGSMNKYKLFWWTYLELLPRMNAYPNPNSIIVLDNVSFHRNLMFRALCRAHGVKLMYLPPYSPHLNIIELLFNAIKACLKKYQHYCHKDVKKTTIILMEYKLNHINWRNVAREIGYHQHCRGL